VERSAEEYEEHEEEEETKKVKKTIIQSNGRYSFCSGRRKKYNNPKTMKAKTVRKGENEMVIW
jgi:hypothetical protein